LFGVFGQQIGFQVDQLAEPEVGQGAVVPGVGITAIQNRAPLGLQPATVRLMPLTATLAFSQM
jgi:hypothetical protein